MQGQHHGGGGYGRGADGAAVDVTGDQRGRGVEAADFQEVASLHAASQQHEEQNVMQREFTAEQLLVANAWREWMRRNVEK